jgi:hypothetical protein
MRSVVWGLFLATFVPAPRADSIPQAEPGFWAPVELQPDALVSAGPGPSAVEGPVSGTTQREGISTPGALPTDGRGVRGALLAIVPIKIPMQTHPMKSRETE